MNGRLPFEDGSDRRETLSKRVSDDSRHFIFRRSKCFLNAFVAEKFGVNFFQESRILEELGIFEHHWQIPRRKSLPVVRLFSLYDPWRRGKRVEKCF